MKIRSGRCGLLAAVCVCALVIGSGSMAQEIELAATPRIVTKGAWSATVTYAKDDIVTARGSTWRSKVNGNKNRVPGSTTPNTAASWEAFAVGFNPAGTWSATRTYQPNELAIHQGQTWRAKLTNKNKAPAAGTNWELLAAKGAAGATGATGATGPAGPSTVSAGSSAAPAIKVGDTDTGIYAPQAGKIALVENSTKFLHNIGNGNAAFGLNALETTTPGAGNTALGEKAMRNTSTGGDDNTAVGQFALSANIAGSQNTAVGNRALANNNGNNSTAVGYQALTTFTGSSNTAIGFMASYGNQSGANNTAVGHQALVNSETADNTAIGHQALSSQTNLGNSNTAVGMQALTSNTSGVSNVAVGVGAGYGNLDGQDNVYLGINAAHNGTTGDSNVMIGRNAGYNSEGNRNVAIGDSALTNNTINGNENVALGFNALNTGAGDGNIAIGKDAGTPVTGTVGSGNILIANRGVDADNNKIRIGTIGAPDAQTTFIAGIKDITLGSGVPVYIDTTTGQLGGQPASSRRYKEDIDTMTDVTAMLGKLRPVTFRYIKPEADGSKPLHYGLIAEEVAEVMPYLAIFNADGTLRSVHYDRLPTFLLAGWQAQQKTIAAQAGKIEALEARLARLEAVAQTKAASLRP